MRALSLSLLALCIACSGGTPADETVEPVELDTHMRPPNAAGPPAPTEALAPPAHPSAETTPTAAAPVAPSTPTQRVDLPASDATSPPALTPGQWVRYGLTWRDGSRSTMDYRVVGVDGDTTNIEIEDARRGHAKTFHMTVKFGDRSSAEAFQITALRVQDRGETQTIPERMLQQYQPLLQHFLELMAVNWASGEKQDIEVPAGTFHGCTVKQRDASYGGVTQHAQVFYHPGVPVTGMVRFQGSENNQTFELMGFGSDGPTH